MYTPSIAAKQLSAVEVHGGSSRPGLDCPAMRAISARRRLASSSCCQAPPRGLLPPVRRRSFALQADAGLPPLRARVRAAALACAAAATVSGASVASVAVWREHKGKTGRFSLFDQLRGGSAAARQQGWWQQAARTAGIDPRHISGLLDGAIGPIMLINTAVYLLWCVAPQRVMQRHFTSSIRGPPWGVLLGAFSHMSSKRASNLSLSCYLLQQPLLLGVPEIGL